MRALHAGRLPPRQPRQRSKQLQQVALQRRRAAALRQGAAMRPLRLQQHVAARAGKQRRYLLVAQQQGQQAAPGLGILAPAASRSSKQHHGVQQLPGVRAPAGGIQSAGLQHAHQRLQAGQAVPHQLHRH